MLHQINCQTDIEKDMSGLYASALSMCLAYIEPKELTEDIANNATNTAENQYYSQIQKFSQYDTEIPSNVLMLPATGKNTVNNLDYTYADKYYKCDNGAARLALCETENEKALMVAFRGTDQIIKDGMDYPDFDRHYALFAPFVEQINTLMKNDVSIQKLYVVGHSLGGAMVEEFIHQFKGSPYYDKIRGVTFGSAGSRYTDISDACLLNFAHNHDFVPNIASIKYDVHGVDWEIEKPDTAFCAGDFAAHSKLEYLDSVKQLLSFYDLSKTEKFNAPYVDQIPKIGFLDVQDTKVVPLKLMNSLTLEKTPGTNPLEPLERLNDKKNVGDLLNVSKNVDLGNKISQLDQKINNPLTMTEKIAPMPVEDTVKAIVDSSYKGKLPKFKAFFSELKKGFLNKEIYEAESAVISFDNKINLLKNKLEGDTKKVSTPA